MLLLEKTYQHCRLHIQVISKARWLGLRLNQPSQNTTSRKQPTRSPQQSINQRPHIIWIDVSRTVLNALQVPQLGFGVGAHHMPTAVTVQPPTTLAMPVGNGVIGNKYVGPPPYMRCQKPLLALELARKMITLSPMKFIRFNLPPEDSMLTSTWVPRHHHQSTSDFKLTPGALVTQFT